MLARGNVLLRALSSPLGLLPMVFVVVLPSSAESPLHEAGELLAEGHDHKVYAHYALPCQDGGPGRRWANLSFLQAYDAEIPDDPGYRQLYASVLAPVLPKVCPGASHLRVRHFIQGTFIASNGLTYDDSNQFRPTKGEIPLGAAELRLDRQGKVVDIARQGYATYGELYDAVSDHRAASAQRAERAEDRYKAWLADAASRFLPPRTSGDLKLCNEGTVDLAAAILHTENGAQRESNDWVFAGWRLVPRDRCEQIAAGGGYVNVVLAQVGADYRLGIVRYVPSRTEGEEGSTIDQICVGTRNESRNGDGLPRSLMPPCPPGTFPAPRSFTRFLRTWGGASHQSIITVEPKPTDTVFFALRDGAKVPWKPASFLDSAPVSEPLRLLEPSLPTSQARNQAASAAPEPLAPDAPTALKPQAQQLLLKILGHEIGTASVGETVRQMRELYGTPLLNHALAQMLAHGEGANGIQLAKPFVVATQLGDFADSYTLDALMHRLAAENLKFFLIELNRHSHAVSGSTIGLDKAIAWYDELVAKHGETALHALAQELWQTEKQVLSWRSTTWDGKRFYFHLAQPEHVGCATTNILWCLREKLGPGSEVAPDGSRRRQRGRGGLGGSGRQGGGGG